MPGWTRNCAQMMELARELMKGEEEAGKKSETGGPGPGLRQMSAPAAGASSVPPSLVATGQQLKVLYLEQAGSAILERFYLKAISLVDA